MVVGELGQDRRVLSDAARDLVDAFMAATGLPIDRARSLLAKFGLGAEAALRPPASLSPGERTRAELAAFAARGVNFLVLDEPTNHLDLPAIEQLESALDGYEGTLLLVSHDRRLLEAVHGDAAHRLAGTDEAFRGLPGPVALAAMSAAGGADKAVAGRHGRRREAARRARPVPPPWPRCAGPRRARRPR